MVMIILQGLTVVCYNNAVAINIFVFEVTNDEPIII